MAIEEMGTAGIRDQGARNSGRVRLRLSAKQGVEMFSLEADFGARKRPEIFRQSRRIGFLAFEESAEISVPGLRSNFARRHPQIRTHHGV